MSLLKKIKSAIAVLKIKPNSTVTHDFIKITQEDSRDTQARKRVKDLFDKEEKYINTRALNPHSCDDPIGCQKDDCYKWQPDKIIGKPYTVVGSLKGIKYEYVAYFETDKKVKGKRLKKS